MRKETMINLENDFPSSLSKRKCVDDNFLISEADAEDTLTGISSHAEAQITQQGWEGSMENFDVTITVEISCISTLTKMEQSHHVDADRGFNLASQSSSEIMAVPATKVGNENSPQNETDEGRTFMSDHEIREKSEQHPEKIDNAGDASIPLIKVTMNGNVQSDKNNEKGSSDEERARHATALHRDDLAEPANCIPKQVSPKRKKLLVLDINGLLADIVSRIPTGYKSDAKIARRAVFKRPFCTDFLMFCFETFQVGIWSSRTKNNVEKVISFLLGDLTDRLLFCWDATQCTATGFSTLENRHKTLVFKEIRMLWEPENHSFPWGNGHFDESNTLLVDDSPYKALLNPPHTAIFPPSYSYRDRHDTSLGPGGDIRAYLEGLATADHVQQYVKQHPFGQGAISQASPSWDFYYKAVISLFKLQSPNT